MGRITFKTFDGDTYEIDSDTRMSIMRIATSNAIPGIEAECGGVLSCATCHVYVDPDWQDKIDTPTRAELDMLSFVEQPQANSRLSCQIIFTNALDGLVIHIPERQ
ncbi:MAG: 2Fe-2S iron-sulfur cluster-binding protein [bacterium]